MKKRVITVLCVIVAIGIILAGVLIYFTMKKKTVKQAEVDMSEFRLPDGAVWEGSYIDRIESLAVLTITKNGDEYVCSIGIPSEDMSYIDSYEFVAGPAKDGVGLSYEDGIHTQYLISGASGADGVMGTQRYNNGTGGLYYYDGAVLWVDDINNAGSGYLFVKQEEPANEPSGEL